MLIAGSPCQGFSFAGKQLNFDDPRSALFFEFVRLLKEIKPKYFILENVRMKKEYLSIISEKCGVEPYFFNSAKVSAQNRLRYYWTNLNVNKYIDDKGIVLRDILETDPDNTHILSEQMKSRVMNTKRGKGYFYTEKSEKIGTVISGYSKQPTDGSYLKLFKPVNQTERNRRHLRKDDQKSLCLTATMWKGAGNNGMTLVEKKSKIRDKSKTVRSGGRGSYDRHEWDSVDELHWRKLTPLECERLQTVPDNYTEGVSNTQRYKMLGNGWTVDIIVHILKSLFK